MKYKDAEFRDLVGKTLLDIKNNNNESLFFTCSDGSVFEMSHYQDCCEDVSIEDIDDNMGDLIGKPILMAEESSNAPDNCETWTFYKLSTIKGDITIRWYGESNGYYATDVDFYQITEDGENNV